MECAACGKEMEENEAVPLIDGGYGSYLVCRKCAEDENVLRGNFPRDKTKK